MERTRFRKCICPYCHTEYESDFLNDTPKSHLPVLEKVCHKRECRQKDWEKYKAENGIIELPEKEYNIPEPKGLHDDRWHCYLCDKLLPIGRIFRGRDAHKYCSERMEYIQDHEHAIPRGLSVHGVFAKGGYYYDASTNTKCEQCNKRKEKKE